LGRVIFSGKAEPSLDWSAIASRLQEISKPSSSSACDANLGVDPSVTLANDLPALSDRSAALCKPAPSSDPTMMAEQIHSTCCHSWQSIHPNNPD
jgi:hypothetical protein